MVDFRLKPEDRPATLPARDPHTIVVDLLDALRTVNEDAMTIRDATVNPSNVPQATLKRLPDRTVQAFETAATALDLAEELVRSLRTAGAFGGVGYGR